MASEKDLERAVQLLEALHDQLSRHDTLEAKKWLREVTELQNFSTGTSAIIGIVGATGAGKSTLINALLDEEKFLPTNCMRSCTAVVTQISYNNSNIPFRAEVDFLRKEDWNKELEALIGDLVTDKGNIATDSVYKDSEAGLAYTKIRAVYPCLTKEQIASSTIDELLTHEAVSCLGTVKKIECDDLSTFYKELQIYIDSKEKVDLRPKSAKPSQVMEFWPLIKVVRLYIRSRVLETGAVLVDLPGINDSNAARAAVSETYLKECTGLIIVAPINRAVDDKLAKDLLGQSFKRQLKLDGNLGNLTWVCSQTDVISESGVEEMLKLGYEIDPCRQRQERLQTSNIQLETELKRLRATSSIAFRNHQNIEAELRDYLSSGRTSATEKSDTSRKRKRTEDYGYKSMAEGSNDSSDLLKPSLSLRRITKLEQRKATVLAQWSNDSVRANAIEQQMREQTEEIAQLSTKKRRICTAERNEYSRAAIRQDFAAGVREMDFEMAEENDPRSFDPTELFHDYDEVVNSLPVFCVSSHAYQQLCGRLKEEDQQLGFQNVQDTEIPQLQDHCRSIAEVLGTATLKKYLLRIELLCNSLKLWASDGQGQQDGLTNCERQDMENALNGSLDNFSKALVDSGNDLIVKITRSIDTDICDSLTLAVQRAQNSSATTVRQWGRLHHSTYCAVLRRGGCFANRSGVYDFNKELADPLLSSIVYKWENVFACVIPALIASALAKCEAATPALHAQVVAIADFYDLSASPLKLLRRQLRVYIKNVKEMFSEVGKVIQHAQRETNREFTPQISKHMLPIYDECLLDHGPGVHVRVQTYMQDQVRDSGGLMFRSCTTPIEDRLKQMIKAVDLKLQHHICQMSSLVKRDYMQLVTCRKKKSIGREILLKKAIANCVNEYKAMRAAKKLSTPDVLLRTETRLRPKYKAEE